MKALFLLGSALLCSRPCFAALLPVITSDPQTQTVWDGNTATFNVGASGATSYEWRFNGATIAGATTATLSVTGAQPAKAGYYLAVAKNSYGSVPSKLAYLSVGAPPSVPSAYVPLRNSGNSHAQASYQAGLGDGPINNAVARVVAGPALDQMAPLPGDPLSTNAATVVNGYFNGFSIPVPSVESGQYVFYRVEISYSNSAYSSSGVFTQQSTVLNIPTSAGVSSVSNLYFPRWIEWPDPYCYATTGTNRVVLPGETCSVTNSLFGYFDLGSPSFQWRKDGKLLGSPVTIPVVPYYYSTNYVLTITNCQPSDAGVYDLQCLGNNWFIGPKFYLSVQTTGGAGLLQNPRITTGNFSADLAGAQGRRYKVQWSSNLVAWSDLMTLTNTSGVTTFSNSLPAASTAFYRTCLLP